MKQYMIVGEIEEGMVTSYADDYTEAHNKKMDIEIGLGGYAELYERLTRDELTHEYVLIEV